MPRMQRNNVVLRVDEEDVPRYLNLGYNLTDDQGNIIKAALPQDLGTLQLMYIKQQQQIANLETTVAELTQKLTELQRQHTATNRKTKN